MAVLLFDTAALPSPARSDRDGALALVFTPSPSPTPLPHSLNGEDVDCCAGWDGGSKSRGDTIRF